MKLTLLFLLAGLITVSASTYSQNTRLDIKVKNNSIFDLFREIEKKSEFYFFFQKEELAELDNISVNQKNAKVTEILDEVLKGTTLDYKIVDRYIIIRKDGKSFDDVEFQSLQQNTITGKVSDETGQPLPGVTIMIKGTVNGTVTNADGDYSLTDIPENATLIFSFVGMETQEIVVANQTNINVTMATSSIGIEEIVAIGYGTMRKVDLTGAVSTLSSDNLVKISTTSTAQALQGRMTGVQVTQNNGEPGSGSTIKIRGIGSLRSNNSPLILIDGFLGDIDGVDPYDIESVSVLKDASAAAIYGARAANGVILVTTKRGKAGKLRVDVVVEHGVSTLTKQPQFLNSRDFATKQNEENIWGGSDPLWVGEYAPENLTGGTQWFDEIYSTGSINKVYVNLSGGNENTTYALSLGNTYQNGMIDNTSFNRMNARFNFDHKFNNWLSVGANLSLDRDKRHNGNENIWGDGIKYNGYGLGLAAVRSSPTVPAYFPDGTKGIYLVEIPGEYPGNGTLPPHWYMGYKDFNTAGLNNRVSLFAEVKIIDGLKYKAVVNTKQGSDYTTNWSGTWEAYQPGGATPAQANSINGLFTKSGTNYGWEVQQLLTYDKSFGDHSISALAGFSAEERTNEWVSLGKEIFPNNELRVANAGTEIYSNEGSKRIISYESLFGRLQYDYADRYLLQFTVRRDGSSAFAPGNQYGIFPSISGAWRVTEESFMKNQSLFSNLKIRAGYGQLGNAGIPSFKWISTYKLVDGHAFGAYPQSYNPAYYPTEMTNEDVKWETTTTLDIGLDFSVLNNKLTVEFDYYDKSTTDLLWPATIPETAGNISGPMVNIGEVSNKGWELTLNWDDNIGEFRYGFSANISHNENMIVDMGGIPDQLDNNVMIKEGYPINSFWGNKVDGIWRTWEELENNAHRSGDIRPGDFRFLDINGVDDEGNETGEPDGVINSYDQDYLGNPLPDFYYGFSGYAEYKGFDFSFLVYGEAGKETMIEAVYGGGYRPGFNAIQYYFDNRAVLDDNGEVISGTLHASGANSAGGNASFGSQADMHDISFMRIRNIQLGYTLPANILSRMKIRNARIYVNATNPFIFTKYVGWDQETSVITSGKVNRGGNQYVPVAKTISVGLNVKF